MTERINKREMVNRKVVIIVGIVVSLILLMLLGIDDKDRQVNRKKIGGSQLSLMQGEQKNNVEIRHVQNNIKKKIKDQEKVIIQNEIVEYIGPKGKNINVYVFVKGEKHSIKIPLGEINLSQAQLKVFDQVIPLSSVKKLHSNQLIKIIIDSDTNILRSISVENKQSTNIIEEENIGDLPKFIVKIEDVQDN